MPGQIYPTGGSVYLKFTTRAFSTGIPTTLAGSPVVSIYKDDSLTQSTAGVTLTVDFDSVTGLNHVTIDTTADATFYANGHTFYLVITTGTVSSVSVVGEAVGNFDLAAAVVTAGNTLAVDSSGRVDVGKALGIAVTLDANNVLNVSAKYWAGTPITATSIPVATAAGAAGGLFIAGSNAATTFASLTVTTTTTLTGAVSLGSTLGVTGTTTLAAVNAGAVTFNSFTVTTTTTLTGAVLLSSTLGITGATTFTGVVTATNGIVANIAGNLVGTVSTLTTYTGNTPQTGDSYARIGATGSGLTSLAPSSTALSTATWTSGRATNLDNLDATISSVLAAVSNIAVTSAALNATAASATYTTGTSTGGSTNTFTIDGVFDSVAAVGNAIDIYYEFDLSATTGAAAVGATWDGYLAGAVNTIKVYAYNWGGSSWDQVGNITGIAGTMISAQEFDLTSSHTGTGGNLGKARIRFAATGLTTGTLKTDRILLGYAVVIVPPANFASMAITVAGGVTLADGVAHGGTTATLRLGSTTSTPPFHVSNSGGDAVLWESTDGGGGKGFHLESATGGAFYCHSTDGIGAAMISANANGWFVGSDGAGSAACLSSGGGIGLQVFSFGAAAVSLEPTDGPAVRAVPGLFSLTEASGIVIRGVGTGSAVDITATGTGNGVNVTTNAGHTISLMPQDGDGIHIAPTLSVNSAATGISVAGAGTGSGFDGTLSPQTLASFFVTDSTKVYADAIDGSVVKEIATNAGGGGSDPNVILSGVLGDQSLGDVVDIVLPSGPADNSVLVGNRLRITSGVAQYQERTIYTWDGTNKIAGIDQAFAVGTPTSGDSFEVFYDHLYQLEAGGNVLSLAQVSGFNSGALAQLFTVNTTKIYADAVDGSVVKETAGNATVSGTVDANVVEIGGVAAGDDTEQASTASTFFGRMRQLYNRFFPEGPSGEVVKNSGTHTIVTKDSTGAVATTQNFSDDGSGNETIGPAS